MIAEPDASWLCGKRGFLLTREVLGCDLIFFCAGAGGGGGGGGAPEHENRNVRGLWPPVSLREATSRAARGLHVSVLSVSVARYLKQAAFKWQALAWQVPYLPYLREKRRGRGVMTLDHPASLPLAGTKANRGVFIPLLYVSTYLPSSIRGSRAFK